jgi:hypothetical protein
MFSICFALLWLASCGSKQEEVSVTADPPEDLIPREKMVLVLADVHLLESVIGFKAPNGGSRTPFKLTPTDQIQMLPDKPNPVAVPYYEIFSRHGYTRDQYERSLQWYALDAEEYSLMYDEVINELTRRQAQTMGTPAPRDTTQDDD